MASSSGIVVGPARCRRRAESTSNCAGDREEGRCSDPGEDQHPRASARLISGSGRTVAQQRDAPGHPPATFVNVPRSFPCKGPAVVGHATAAPRHGNDFRTAEDRSCPIGPPVRETGRAVPPARRGRDRQASRALGNSSRSTILRRGYLVPGEEQVKVGHRPARGILAQKAGADQVDRLDQHLTSPA